MASTQELLHAHKNPETVYTARAHVLLARGANVRAVTPRDQDRNKNVEYIGATALHNACEVGNLEVVKLLMEAGAEVNILDTCAGYTPLVRACANEHFQIVEYLLTQGADPNYGQGVHQRTRRCEVQVPLYFAVKHGQLQLVTDLLNKHSANVNAKCGLSGNLPLFTVKTVEMAMLLLEAGAEVNAVNTKGETALNNISKEGLLVRRKLVASKGSAGSGQDVWNRDLMDEFYVFEELAGLIHERGGMYGPLK